MKEEHGMRENYSKKPRGNNDGMRSRGDGGMKNVQDNNHAYPMYRENTMHGPGGKVEIQPCQIQSSYNPDAFRSGRGY